MVEYYLCHFKKPSERKSKGKTALSENALDDALADMCAASDYVREYYLATQTLPQAVARHVWTRLWFDLTEACIHISGRRQKDMEEVWPWLSKLAETLHVSLSWVPRFLPWGQSIFFSSANDWYRSFDGFMEIYFAYQWIWKIFSDFGDTDYRGEAS